MYPSPEQAARHLSAALVFLLLAASTDAQTPGIKIVVVEGQGAINNIQQHRAKEPVVQVTEDQKPVQGASVTFILPDDGPSGVFANGARMMTIQTDEKGQAVGRGLRPNQTAGRLQIRVTASFHGQTAGAVISQINAEPAGATSGGNGKKFLILALIGGAAAGGIAAAMGGRSSSSASPASSSPPGTILAPGTPVIQPPH
ncbi:MAG: hypothetical protein JWO48_1896 [Bryobacterales bacterium]|nr:hypothetical protein [Bryobacterales bacterium]